MNIAYKLKMTKGMGSTVGGDEVGQALIVVVPR
jgi:hypothetical protein